MIAIQLKACPRENGEQGKQSPARQSSVIASAAKQSPKPWGLLRRFTPRNDSRDALVRNPYAAAKEGFAWFGTQCYISSCVLGLVGSLMFIIGNFISALADVLNVVLTIYMWIVIIAALISWVNPDPYNPIVRFLYSVTEPVFAMVRRRLPFPPMGIDFSPLIVLVVILFLQSFLVKTLHQIAVNLQ